jgi:sec-independent protein translocase protein TatA
MFSPTELLVILLIVVILFGGKKLPDLARSLGRSMGEFKKGCEEGETLTHEKKDQPVELAADTTKKIDGPKA